VAERLTTGAVPVPVPERLMACGLLLALSVMATAPVRVPVPVGVKVTLIVQLFPVATLVPQLFVCPKSPLATILEIASAALPVLVNLTDWALLEVSIAWPGKLRLTGDKATAGASTGAGMATVPPAPHEMDRKASAMQTVARIAAFARRRFKVVVSMRNARGARVLPISVRVVFSSSTFGYIN